MRNRTPKRIICLTIVLSLLCTGAAAATFSFHGGVTWDTTIDQMMAAEGLTEGDGTYNQQPRNGYEFFYLKASKTYYVFREDQLVMAYTEASAGAYDGELERKTAQYGTPADVSADTVSALLNRLLPGSATAADFSSLTAWRLSDGTLAALFVIGGDSFMAYFHEQRIGGA